MECTQLGDPVLAAVAARVIPAAARMSGTITAVHMRMRRIEWSRTTTSVVAWACAASTVLLAEMRLSDALTGWLSQERPVSIPRPIVGSKVDCSGVGVEMANPPWFRDELPCQLELTHDARRIAERLAVVTRPGVVWPDRDHRKPLPE